MGEHCAKDYWKAGPVYVRRELLLLAAAVASAAVLAVFGLPLSLFSPLDSLPPAYRYDDGRLAEISGVVRVLDGAGRVRYEGEVAMGAYTGQGRVFDESGQLVYDGPLVDGTYEGPDAEVYRDGVLVYAGGMAGGLYEGPGRRIDSAAGVISEGQFSQGVLEGQGREYTLDGTLLREGTFSQDRLEGEGREYSREGILLREGNFSAGLLHGDGLEYTAGGAPRYEGQFRRGVYHGQGTLYDTLLDTPLYRGSFVDGAPMGLGTICHPSGQPLYTGQVYDAAPRADAFLGLSLEELEEAFAIHWLLYAGDGVTAFVYPYFQLMFLTESPVELTSPAQREDQSRQERQELLDALAAESREQSEEHEDGPSERDRGDSAPAPVGMATDEVLALETDKSAVVITQVLSYGRALPGVAQPDMGAPTGLHAAGWREWFSGWAMGREACGAVVRQTGPFVFRFSAGGREDGEEVEEFRTQDAGVETLSVWMEGKEMSLWYQAARWAREP